MGKDPDTEPANLHKSAYDPEIIPPPELMITEGIDTLEEWFRWAEEWSMILRIFGKITPESHLLEIGCGLGRIAFPLRYILSKKGSYHGFDITLEKIDFLKSHFENLYPNFTFSHADLHNTFYNPNGKIAPKDFSFPYSDSTFDLVYAASVFTHMLPENARRYFAESSRVLKPDGLCIFSFFQLDRYNKKIQRPHGFSRSGFDFDHAYKNHGNRFAISNPDNPEEMTAYSLSLISEFVYDAGLSLELAPVPGLWSGTSKEWVGAQDLLILRKA